VRELQNSGKVCPVALWDENPDKGSAQAKAWGMEFESDYDWFLARNDFSAVICNAPTTMHPRLLTKAAAAKKDIFTEKLIATNSVDAEKTAAAIRASGVIFTISLPLRCNAAVLYVKELVDNGSLGRISGARFRRSHAGVSDHWLPDHWFDANLSGGGAMMDLGAHPVYLLSFLFGAPKRVSGMTTSLYNRSPDENAVAIAEFTDGVLGVMETAFVTFGAPDLLEVYGTEGSVCMSGDTVRLSTKPLAAMGVRDAQPERLPPAKPSPVMQFAEACIARAASPEYLGLDDALLMTRIVEAVYRSDATGHTVLL
jgi:predicted dehydrogenase